MVGKIAFLVMVNVVFFAPDTALSKPIIIVHLPAGARPRAVQRKLNTLITSMDFVVYGRSADFQRALLQGDGDAFLAFRASLEKGKRKVEVALQGVNKGRTWEPYVLIGKGRTQLGDGVSLAALDLIGRRLMPTYVQGLLNLERRPSLKVAARVEDLVTLLQINRVQLILARESSIAAILEKTNVELKITKLRGVSFGYPALNIENESMRATILSEFLSMDGEAKRLLGVEEWTQ